MRWVAVETVGVAFQSIRAGKLRAALTMLGIIIGVAAVIAMVALGTGAQRAIDEKIADLGSNLLSIYAGQRHVRGVASSLGAPLTTDDARALSRDAPLLGEVVPQMQQLFQLEHQGENLNVNVLGTTPNYHEVRNYQVPSAQGEEV